MLDMTPGESPDSNLDSHFEFNQWKDFEPDDDRETNGQKSNK